MNLLQLQLGDCWELMHKLPACSIGAVVCDPPYGLEFMGKNWDAPWRDLDPLAEEDEPPSTLTDKQAFQEWAVRWMTECHRILQPGGMIKVFGGTRTFHRMGIALVQAGFKIERLEAWVYGSGFPKSLDVSKALDKSVGAVREILATRKGRFCAGTGRYNWNNPNDTTDRSTVPVTEPATELAKKYKGYGTCLKPAWEPFLVGRKYF